MTAKEPQSQHGPKAKFGKQYFVNWDDKKAGGEWYESDITKKPSDPTHTYTVKSHDGDTKFIKGSRISKAGVKSEEGDTILAYHKGGRNYAFAGTHVATKGNKIYVRYDDGDTNWEDSTNVHKLVTLYSLVFDLSGKFHGSIDINIA